MFFRDLEPRRMFTPRAISHKWEYQNIRDSKNRPRHSGILVIRTRNMDTCYKDPKKWDMRSSQSFNKARRDRTQSSSDQGPLFL